MQRTGDPALNIFEISGLAWAAAVDRAMQVLAAEPEVDFDAYQQSPGAVAMRLLDPADTSRLDAELRGAGFVGPDGAIRAQWLLAVAISATAPIRVSAVARTADESAHTDLALAGGRGIAVSYRRRVRTTAAGTDVPGVHDVVEVALFEEQHAWAAVRRILPDHAELLAGTPSAGSTPSREGGRDVVGARELQDPGNAGVDPDITAAVLAPRCTVYLDVVAAPPGQAAAYLASDVWSLADNLYSVRTSGDGGGSLVLVDAAPGDIARELSWRLLGAREFLAGAAGKVA